LSKDLRAVGLEVLWPKTLVLLSKNPDLLEILPKSFFAALTTTGALLMSLILEAALE